MDHLQQIEVEGFKGIDNLNFNPGSLNVITGRNNSGKTSFLESIDIALQPGNLLRFGPNFSTLINHHYEESRIQIQSNEEDIDFTIREAFDDEIPDYLMETYRQELRDRWEMLSPEKMEEEDVVEVIDNEFIRVFNEQLEEVDLSEAKEEILVLSINEEEYPFVYFGSTVSDYYSLVYDEMEALVEEHYMEEYRPGGKQSTLSEIIMHTSFRGMSPGRFVKKRPRQFKPVTFIDFVQLSQTLDISRDDVDPVKIDNIGDFIREKGLVDGLKTFDVDHLIFEDEDGEKYSVPFEFMGEGFKSIVGVLWELLDEERLNEVVLLEEPETHMHPGYVRELIYFLIQLVMEEEIQIFITTHNNDFLNDFFNENLTDREWKFLRDEFKLMQLQDGFADVMTHEEAEEQLKDLQLDLRGL